MYNNFVMITEYGGMMVERETVWIQRRRGKLLCKNSQAKEFQSD